MVQRGGGVIDLRVR